MTHSNHTLTHEDHHHAQVAQDKKTLGFWIYLMTDCILFGALFATYAVLVNGTAGGPVGKDIFDLELVATETALLLFSSMSYGFALLAMRHNKVNQVLGWLGVTFILGACFIGLECYEFAHLLSQDLSPQRSAFLSAFFALVGTHGLHVLAGLIWLVVMVVHIRRRGLNATNQTRLLCLSLYWHFLDLIWIAVFSVVYLTGAI